MVLSLFLIVFLNQDIIGYSARPNNDTALVHKDLSSVKWICMTYNYFIRIVVINLKMYWLTMRFKPLISNLLGCFKHEWQDLCKAVADNV